MSNIESLMASATTFDVLGLTFDAETCRDLARDCAAISNTFGSDKAEALYRDWTTQMAVRAVSKIQEYGERI